MAIYGVIFVNTFAVPVTLNNIPCNYFFIFVAWDVIESVIWYFFGLRAGNRWSNA